MMRQDWSPEEQESDGTEESAASNAPLSMVAGL